MLVDGEHLTGEGSAGSHLIPAPPLRLVHMDIVNRRNTEVNPVPLTSFGYGAECPKIAKKRGKNDSGQVVKIKK